MAVARHVIHIEEVHQVELSDMDIEATHRKRRQKRERAALDPNRIGTQRDDFAQPEARDVWARIELGVPDRIHVGEASQSEDLAQPATSRAFDIQNGFDAWIELETGVERRHFGSGLLGSMLKAMRSAVLGAEARMPLEDEVSLPR